LRHVFSHLAIAAGGSLNQHTVLIAQAHRQAIELEFGHVLDRGRVVGQSQFTAHASIKSLRAAGLGIGFRANAEHGHGMPNTRKGIQHPAAHAQGG